MKKNWKTICIFISILAIPPGCDYDRTPLSDIMPDNQQIVTTINPETARYDCDTLVITCIDYRFAIANQDFINETLGLKDNYDHISIPGSILDLVNSDTRDLLFSKFALTVRLHQIKQVVVIVHIDCGAYGGSSSFGSETAEKEILYANLKEAEKLLIEKYPTLEVTLFLESLVKEGDQARVHFEKVH